MIGVSTNGDNTIGLAAAGVRMNGLSANGERMSGVNTCGDKMNGDNTIGLSTNGMKAPGERMTGCNASGVWKIKILNNLKKTYLPRWLVQKRVVTKSGVRAHGVTESMVQTPMEKGSPKVFGINLG